jgi:hypothetical protein
MQRQKREQPLLLTRAETRDLLEVSDAALLKLERKGMLTPIRLNSRYLRFRKTEVMRFLNGEINK